MKRYRSILACGLAVLSLTAASHPATKKAAAAPKNIFQGTWCVGGEGLIIHFIGKDSISVTTHKKDGTMQGVGTYVNQDSLLNATVTNKDVTLKLGFLYKVKDATTIRAKMYYLMVDGDKLDHPSRWMRLKKCNPATFDFTDTTSADKETTKAPASKAGQTVAKKSADSTSHSVNPTTKPAAETPAAKPVETTPQQSGAAAPAPDAVGSASPHKGDTSSHKAAQ